jgi:cytidylate kinase
MPSTTRRSPRRRTSARPHVRTSALVVTIDGPAGCGKSTVAKQLARELGLMYLDTGATYRTLALAALQEEPPVVADAGALAALARQLPIRLEMSGDRLRVFLGDDDVTKKIRAERVTEAAAQVSQYPEVRAAMVERQRELASRYNVVVEGRDTGSVVFPHAAHKFFLDADPAVRAKRRQQELFKLYGSQTPLAMIREQIELRDGLDRSRKVGPLVQPLDAIRIDTTRKTVQGVVRKMLRVIRRSGRPS